jgi:MSHA pilin protein MshC
MPVFSSSRIKSVVKNDRGFTIVELVGTLIIVGILSAVALPRFFNRGGFEGRNYYDQAMAMLQYGQKVAIAQNRNVYVRLDGASVALCFDSTCTAKVTAPSGTNSGTSATVAACGSANTTWFCEAAPSGVSYTVTPAGYNSANPSFYFSALGKPFGAADAPPTSTFNSTLTIIVTDGSTPHTFYVEQETGYVHP